MNLLCFFCGVTVIIIDGTPFMVYFIFDLFIFWLFWGGGGREEAFSFLGEYSNG